MKIRYDPSTDTLSLILKEGIAVAQGDEDKPGVILDHDTQGDLVYRNPRCLEQSIGGAEGRFSGR